MKTLFITALFYIRLRGNLGRGIRLPHDLILTNSKDQISELLSDHFESLAGSLETKALRGSNAAIYSIGDQPDDLAEDKARLVVNRQLAHVLHFLMALWLVKDNSVNVELGFLEYPYRKRGWSGMTSNFRAIRFSKADGSIEETEFTDTEARNARDLHSKLFANVVDRDEYSGYLLPEDFPRLSRVYYFAQAARGSSDLGDKIAGYVTCFEALFCTDPAEMSHKLAERVAFFLGENPTDRGAIFRNIKNAYNIRSKTVHGDKITKKLAEQASSIASICNDLVRKSLKKIFLTPGLPEVFTADSGRLEDYLTSLVLGGDGT